MCYENKKTNTTKYRYAWGPHCPYKYFFVVMAKYRLKLDHARFDHLIRIYNTQLRLNYHYTEFNKKHDTDTRHRFKCGRC